MKKGFLSALLIATTLSGAAQAETIFEAMGSAYENNPTLQAQRAYLRSIDEKAAIARSGFRPTISLNGGYNDLKTNDDLETSTTVNEGQTGTTISADITQPVFSGFSTVNTVKSTDSAIRAQQNSLMNVEQETLLSASTAYFDVIQNKAIVDLQKNNEKLLKKRLDETLERFKVGEVTRTDVSQAKARYSSAQADRIDSEGTLESSIAEYVRIIGNEPKDLTEPGDINKYLPKDFRSAYEYAKEHNYSIQEARHQLDSQTYNVAAQTGALLPVVNLTGSVSKNNSDPHGYDGEHTTDNVEWGVNMSVPLYRAGETRAKIRQSKYQKWQAQENVLAAERQVRYDIKNAWEFMVTNKARISSIKDQVKANEVALDGVQKEEALGNRTILDVLNAYQELLNSNVEEVKAKRDYYVSSMQLLMAMGKLTAKDLELEVELYDAQKYYDETKGKWLTLSIDD